MESEIKIDLLSNATIETSGEGAAVSISPVTITPYSSRFLNYPTGYNVTYYPVYGYFSDRRDWTLLPNRGRPSKTAESVTTYTPPTNYEAFEPIVCNWYKNGQRVGLDRGGAFPPSSSSTINVITGIINAVWEASDDGGFYLISYEYKTAKYAATWYEFDADNKSYFIDQTPPTRRRWYLEENAAHASTNMYFHSYDGTHTPSSSTSRGVNERHRVYY